MLKLFKNKDADAIMQIMVIGIVLSAIILMAAYVFIKPLYLGPELVTPGCSRTTTLPNSIKLGQVFPLGGFVQGYSYCKQSVEFNLEREGEVVLVRWRDGSVACGDVEIRLYDEDGFLEIQSVVLEEDEPGKSHYWRQVWLGTGELMEAKRVEVECLSKDTLLTEGGLTCTEWKEASETAAEITFIPPFNALSFGMALIITNEYFSSMGGIDKVEATLFYDCKNTMLVEDAKWNPKPVEGFIGLPIGIPGFGVYDFEDCAINKGTDAFVDFGNSTWQLLSPPDNIIKIGTRSACFGPQENCNIKFYCFPGSYCDGTTPSSYVEHTQIAEIEDLYYDFKYTDEIDISDCVEQESKSNSYKTYCLKIESDDSCLINGIDIQEVRYF